MKRESRHNGPASVSVAGALAAVAMVLVLTLRPAWATGDGQAGAKIFAQQCARCHGTDGKGDGPDLVKLQAADSPDDLTDKEINRELSDQKIISMVTKGGKANGKSAVMPAFGDKLGAQQIQDLIAFIRSIAK